MRSAFFVVLLILINVSLVKSDELSIESPVNCQKCNMSRQTFSYSRVIITFENGKTIGLCSINCGFEVINENKLEKINNIQIADYVNHNLIDAKKAIWVIGGNKKGVMSDVAKWAFSDSNYANNYIKINSGKQVTFDILWDVLVKENLTSNNNDTNFSKHFSENKNKSCSHVSIKSNNKKEAVCNSQKCHTNGGKCNCKQDANNKCETEGCYNKKNHSHQTNKENEHKNGMTLQHLNKQTKSENKNVKTPAKPQKNDRCPVCGMFVYKFQDFLGQIQFNDSKVIYFDGPKDLFKFYLGIFEHKEKLENIQMIYLTDYYTLETIDAKDSYFVVGSNVTGPMGKELIPFAKESDAIEFKKDHDGKDIYKFQNVNSTIVEKLQ